MEAGEGGAAAGSVSALPPFLSKTYDMVDDPATDAVVSWGKTSNSFVVWNILEFSRDLLPKYFKHSNFSSFVRQLNTYGFKKVDPDHWEFANEGFLRGYKHLLKNINRRKPSYAQCQQQPAQAGNPSVSSCIDVGDFGIEEVVDSLKRDKNVLMQELVRLRHQQQLTDHQMQTVGQRVHSMEQRQQQMMSFLATAMHSPGFVTQLVHQQTESSRQISGGNKKRKLPNKDEENLAHKYDITSPDGQIVKYQPLMNEAAKAMLRQILIMDKSGMLESNLSDANGFLIDKAHLPSNTLEGGSSSCSMPEVALSEVAPNAASLTKIQSSAVLAQEKALSNMLPKTNTVLPTFVPHSLDGPFKEVESADSCSSSVPGFVNAPVPVASDESLADDDMDHKLPGINDVFWEQFLSDNPFSGDTDEINDVDLEHGVDMDQESEWGKLAILNNLTKQMSLIAAASNSG